MSSQIQEETKNKGCKKVEDQGKENSGAQRHRPTLGVYLFKTFEELFLWAVEGESDGGARSEIVY